MKKEQGIIKAEFKPLIIGFILIFALVPIVVWTALITNDGLIPTIIVLCELTIIGILMIITNIKLNQKNTQGYGICTGVISKVSMGLSDSDEWSRYPVISYKVDGKEYEIKSKTSYGGIISFFLKGIKVKVYYDINDPNIAHTKERLISIVGSMFIFIGIFCLLRYFFNYIIG